jgi:hypothetical protein
VFRNACFWQADCVQVSLSERAKLKIIASKANGHGGRDTHLNEIELKDWELVASLRDVADVVRISGHDVGVDKVAGNGGFTRHQCHLAVT